MCRQVDDFAVASKTRAIATKIFKIVSKCFTCEDDGIGVETSQGMFSRCNGVDIHQTRDYVKLSCETYIDRVLQTHGWDQPSPRESDHKLLVPMRDSDVPALCTDVGPVEGSKEHAALAKKVGFGYRQVLGKLIYACVVGRLDIGYSVALLARFAANPSERHCQAQERLPLSATH